MAAAATGGVASPAGDRMQPFLFGPRQARLYGCLHSPPEGRERGAAVLLVPPHGHEYTRSHRAFRHLAERLAQAGFHALRFDLRGCGDSAGGTADGGVGAWLEDVAVAAAELRRRARPRLSCLLGRRLGGALAALHGAAGGGRGTAVLWDPVVAGTEYLEELERAHDEYVGSPRGRYSGALADPSEKRHADGSLELLGQRLTPEQMEELAALDLARLERPPAARLLLLDSRKEPVLAPFGERLFEILDDWLAPVGDVAAAPKLHGEHEELVL